MPSISIRAPKLIYVAVFAALCGIGWVAKVTLAQGEPVKPAPAQLPDATATAPHLPQDLSPKTVVSNPFQEQLLGSIDSKPRSEPTEPASASSEATPAPSTSVPSSVAPNPADDPEKAALAFVEENQKQAESQLKNLKDEEASLQARLRKVEAGIKRWESLLVALKQSQAVASRVIPGSVNGTVIAEPAIALDPVAPHPKPIPDKK